MEQSNARQTDQPVLGDKGYELFADGKWWPLGLNLECQTVDGALDHWRQRLVTLDEEISARRASFKALDSGLDAPATTKTDDHIKLERELQFLGHVRTGYEATLSMLEQHQTGQTQP